MKQTKWKSVRPQNNSSKKISKQLVWGAVAALTLCVISGSWAAYYFYQKNMSEKLLADAIAHTFVAVTEENLSTDSGTFTYETRSSTPIKIMVDFKATTNKAVGQADANVGIEYSGHTYKLNVLLATFSQEELYVKINGLSSLVPQMVANHPELAAYTGYMSPIAEKLEDTWVKITSADLQQLSGTQAYALKQCSAALNNLKVTTKDVVQIKKIFMKNQFVISSGTPKSEKIGAESTVHYTLNFNSSATQTFMNQVANLKSFTAVKKDCQPMLKGTAPNSNAGLMSTPSENLKNPIIEMWVDAQSHQILKLRLRADNQENKLEFTSGLTDVVKTKSIKKPESSVPVTELKSLFSVLIPPQP